MGPPLPTTWPVGRQRTFEVVKVVKGACGDPGSDLVRRCVWALVAGHTSHRGCGVAGPARTHRRDESRTGAARRLRAGGAKHRCRCADPSGHPGRRPDAAALNHLPVAHLALLTCEQSHDERRLPATGSTALRSLVRRGAAVRAAARAVAGTNTGPRRVPRLVISSCEALENYPPGLPGKNLRLAAMVPGGLFAALQAMRLPAVRRSPLGFGWMAKHPLPGELVEGWLRPAQTDPGVRHDLPRSPRNARRSHMLEASYPFPSF